MTKIKLCGLSKEDHIRMANDLSVDYIGFVFAKKSKRFVSEERAKELKKLLAPTIRAVGVFVQEPIENIVHLCKEGIIDCVQLHGGESRQYLAELGKQIDNPIIQAFRVDTKEDLESVNDSPADLVLLDSGQGGTGEAFAWDLLEEETRAYFLAGGLTIQNVGEAIRRFHPYGVDVSSGIETDGNKDLEKMRKFVECVRASE